MFLKLLTKKSFALICAAIAFVSTASAQSYYDKNLSLGLTINPSISWLNYGDDDAYDASSKVGFSYGLIADIGFSKNYYFSTGLQLNKINSKVTYKGITNANTQNTSDISLQYVDVPLAIKLKSNEVDNRRFYGQFGFTAGFKVSGKQKLEGTSKKFAIEGDDVFRLGLQIGGGAEWKLSNDLALLTGLTYNNGFTRAIKEGKPKTSYLALNIGLLF